MLEQLQERLKEARKDKLKRNRIKRLVDGTSSPKHIEEDENPKNELAYRSFYNPAAYVWGPPGTGKSYNLSRIISAHYQKEKSVLVLAHSNAAVDVLMSEVTKQIEKKNGRLAKLFVTVIASMNIYEIMKRYLREAS